MSVLALPFFCQYFKVLSLYRHPEHIVFLCIVFQVRIFVQTERNAKLVFEAPPVYGALHVLAVEAAEMTVRPGCNYRIIIALPEFAQQRSWYRPSR